MINDIKKFLQKEYKSITGNSVTLTKKGEAKIMANTTSAQPFALKPESDEVKAEIERLQKIIDHNS